MPTRITHHTVVVHRNGKNVRVPPGQAFDFTKDEVAEIHASNPRALRRPVVEARPEPEAVSEVTSEEEVVQPVAPKPGKRKPAPVATDDDDEL